MAEALLLSGQKVIPEKAVKANFEFQFRQLNAALKDLLDS
jgi:NAD dependent epimerase/dehydratase family enzyme